MLLSPQMLMYAYAHRCTYTHVLTAHRCTYTHVLTDALIHMCSQMHLYTCAHRCTYTHVLTDVLIHMCPQMHLNTRAHRCTYTHVLSDADVYCIYVYCIYVGIMNPTQTGIQLHTCKGDIV